MLPAQAESAGRRQLRGGFCRRRSSLSALTSGMKRCNTERQFQEKVNGGDRHGFGWSSVCPLGFALSPNLRSLSPEFGAATIVARRTCRGATGRIISLCILMWYRATFRAMEAARRRQAKEQAKLSANQL